ncbi:MAG TPA: hypothetical protein VF662_15475 [Allosphingosinicella sp.]|jgi:hypothetical protein
MLLAMLHPEVGEAVFSLDNRRMPLSRTKRPRICSARSSDRPADEGVLPSPDDRQRFDMVIVGLKDVRHDEMSDAASPEQKRAMLEVLNRCLSGSSLGRGKI